MCSSRQTHAPFAAAAKEQTPRYNGPKGDPRCGTVAAAAAAELPQHLLLHKAKTAAAATAAAAALAPAEAAAAAASAAAAALVVGYLLPCLRDSLQALGSSKRL